MLRAHATTLKSTKKPAQKQIELELPEEHYRMLKKLADAHNVEMQDLIAEAVAAKLIG